MVRARNELSQSVRPASLGYARLELVEPDILGLQQCNPAVAEAIAEELRAYWIADDIALDARLDESTSCQ